MPIDDALQKIEQIVQEDDDGILNTLMQASSAFSPLAGVLAAVSAAFNASDKDHRVKTAIRAICTELYSIRDSLPSDSTKALKSPWFRKAVCIVIEEAARAYDDDRAAMLALVAVHGCFPDGSDSHRQEDLAAYLRDIVQLSIEDVNMLKLLCTHYHNAITSVPNLDKPDVFAQSFAGFKNTLKQAKIHGDDATSTAARLSGFGLAFQMDFQSSYMSPGDIMFRPTRRGIYVLSLMQKAEASMNASMQHQENA